MTEERSLEDTAREMYPGHYHGDPRDEPVRDDDVPKGLNLETALERLRESDDDLGEPDDESGRLPAAARTEGDVDDADEAPGSETLWTTADVQQYNEMQHYAAQFQQDLQAFAQAKNIDLDALEKEDKGRAAALRAQLNETERELRERYDALRAAAQEMQERAQARQAERFQKAVTREQQKLNEAMPNLDTGALRTYLSDVGFSDRELEHAYDHRLLVLAEKARQFDDLLAGESPGKKVTIPKAKKGAKRGSNKQSRGNNVSDLRARFKKTGRMDHAFELLKATKEAR